VRGAGCWRCASSSLRRSCVMVNSRRAACPPRVGARWPDACSRRQPAVAMPESAASFERRTDLRVDLRNDFLQRRRRADVLVRRLLAPRVERALIRREKVEPGLPVVARAAYACAQHAVRLPELLAAVGA